MITELNQGGTYRDGGSVSYYDNKGNQYWRNFAFKDKGTVRYGVLYKGNINDKKKVKAKGSFILKTRNVIITSSIITITQ